MGWNCNLRIWAQVLVGFVICTAKVLLGITNPGDFAAISSFHTALGIPSLPGWGTGQDPCGDAWQGVVCNDSNIIKIVINAANLGGELGDNLGMFSSIQTIDLSNNHIGGSIPSSLPVTMQNLFLSANEFTGSIPSSISSLTQLSAMSLNYNKLSGELPDSFQGITQLVNFDLSNNNLSGVLPPSVSNLLALTTLHLQDNQLSGTLDVLRDLPLKDLNVENNLFNGPIPEKLLTIPTFRKDGNPFNSSVSPTSPPPVSQPPLPPPPPPSPSKPAQAPPVSEAQPSSQQKPKKHADGPSAPEESSTGRNKKNTKRVVLITLAAVVSFIILVLACVLFMPSCRRRTIDSNSRRHHQIGAYRSERENVGNDRSMHHPIDQIPKVPKEAVVKPKQETQTESQKVPKAHEEKGRNVPRMSAIPKKDHHEVDLSALDVYLMPPPPPPPPPSPPPPPPVEVVTAVSTIPAEVPPLKPPTKHKITSTSAKSFTIASLQQYTNSFSQENLLGEGMLGRVYRAQLPSGKLLAVKKMDKRAFSEQKDDEFLKLVNDIDRIRHANVVELIGYCAEHGERLLIYEYCSSGTLQDALHIALHTDEEFRKKLSWNARTRMALGAARALEYLHEVCQPPIIHRNFKSANVLLDDDLSVRVSDCGLAPLISKGAVSQLSGQLLTAYGYGAPEFESGVYTLESDVYSFGVVMLELLTGRMSYDKTRTRGEQFLVRWAIPQLHDIEALTSMVDPSLNGQYPPKSLSYFADIISKCVQSEPEFRPPMSTVVQDLSNMIRREPHGSGSSED